ncbi:transposase [Microbacterium aurum]|uniref:Transposase n=2 Tax=Microbacterium aurum TaxID=36805 RepID=A0A1P8U9M6_9MICO|nr:transposase [Microbacterium aurum]APZ34765.1 transposase [Microbacterium aurum]MBM7827441.1 transposase [Microbacterium aurum]MBM7828672.1 transposase [Microbacterium aurum]
MEILEAFDATGSYRAAGQLAGCSHHTVAAYVAARDAGRPVGAAARRPRVIDEFLPKVEELVEKTKGKVRADKVHEVLTSIGFEGSERSTRRAVAAVKASWRAGNRRVHRPWVTEPGLWLQYDFGDGPVVGGVKTVLFVAWLAFSRFRVVIPIRDKTLPSVFAALDRTFRAVGGAPTYVLTDNEKTVTTMHIAGVPVRNAQTVSFAAHYGVTVLTCQPADPASKGGAEASVKLAKADLVPTDANLRDQYASFGELEAACDAFMDDVNGREHRVTKRRPVEVLAEEQQRLHPVPGRAHTIAFGVSRRVGENTPMVAFENGQYSVPHLLMGAEVFVRVQGAADSERVVIVHHGIDGPVEVARHDRARPGTPRIDDAHFPAQPGVKVPGDYTIKARSTEEAEFLGIGHGAAAWLLEAAAAGTQRMNQKMREAVQLARIHGIEVVDETLGTAAAYGRFDTGDLTSILGSRITATPARAASETRSLAQGTSGWAAIGQPRGVIVPVVEIIATDEEDEL